MPKVIITENPKSWNIDLQGITVIPPAEYLTDNQYLNAKNTKIINLCKTYTYQSLGYYVSLLAEARGHKVIPKVSTIQDLRYPSLIREDSLEFDDLIQDTLKHVDQNEYDLYIYFGKTGNEQYNRLSGLLFSLIQSPILKVGFKRKKRHWTLQYTKPLNISEVPAEDRDLLSKALQQYFAGRSEKNFQRKKYDLAILINPDETTPPSDSKAIQKFVKAADKVGFSVDLITKNDLGKLSQYDALFIRETTNVNHHTFRFAKKAESEGLVVMDDSESILRCTNKVYLNEVLQAHQIPTPKSYILSKQASLDVLSNLKFPFVIKQPDSCFSQGVVKVNNDQELKQTVANLFQKSDLLIVQEFMPTSFDWRIGVLDGTPFYVCKYFMARNHWQIVNWKNKQSDNGRAETLMIADTPGPVLDMAVKASNLIGDGLYGVDIKESNGQYYVIEVNDNPSIDTGIEDKIIKDQLYLNIMDTFMQRVKAY